MDLLKSHLGIQKVLLTKNLSFDTKRRGFYYFTDLFSCEMA